eukprot:2843903-Amphidinium_carterae.1
MACSVLRPVSRPPKSCLVSASLQVKYWSSERQPPSAGTQARRSARSRKWRIGPRPLPLSRARSQTSVARGHSRVPALSLRCQARIVLRSEVTCGSPAGPP